MKITLIRHTSVNVPSGMIYGQTDVSLCPTFNSEAAKIMKQIEGNTFDFVFSSPLTRCMQLAKKISDKALSDTRLMELNFGSWEGKLWNDINGTTEAKQWFADFVNTPTPKGESYAQMIQRCRHFIDEINAASHKNICIVSHGGPIRTIKSIIENTSPQKAFEVKIAYGEILKLERTHLNPKLPEE